MNGSYLVLKNLVKDFVDGHGTVVRAVDDISLSIERGEFVTLLGPSGCGKTTTLRMIAGFEHATGGSIELEGRDISEIPPYKRNMPMVFQSYALFPHMTIFDNIAYGLKLRGASREQIAADVADACRMVNLGGVDRRYPGELSGGQQQRVALARALVLKPEIILFDEPLSNLDAKLRIQTRTEIKRVQQAMGITALYVTHDQSEALSLSDKIVIMNHGRIAQSGSPTDVYNHPVSPFVSDFIGNANFLACIVEETDAQTFAVKVAGETVRIPAARCEAGLRVGETGRVAVKPESVQVDTQHSPFPAVVDVASFVGPITEYKLLFHPDGPTGGKESQILTAIQSNLESEATVYHAGQEVFLHLKPEQLRLYRA
jgi:iron(III) transport system ATP-binding protein